MLKNVKGSGEQTPPTGSGEWAETISGKPSVIVVGPATLEEGAVPVRDIPHQLVTEPPSVAASANSSIVGDDNRSAGSLADHAEWRTGPGHLGRGVDSAAGTTAAAVGGSNSPDKRAPSVGDGGTHQEELRCVIAIVRHGDRTPKQKLKSNMSEPLVLEYFHKHSENCKKDLKVKAKKPMEEFVKTVKQMIAQKEAEQAEAWKPQVPSGTMIMATGEASTSNNRNLLYKLRHMRDVLLRWKITGLNRKLQIKPRKWEEVIIESDDNDGDKDETVLRCTEVQLILKWGGNLTKLGEKQSINLGRRFRHQMYPDASGGGILRLHSTFRHDLKIKTSDEGRVMKTAAAFAKGK